MAGGMFTPLRHGQFRWLAAGRTASYLANSIAPVALAFAVLDLTGSVVALGVVVGARSVANVLLLLVGGVLADRVPRGVILQGASVLAALSQGTIALSVLLDFASVPLLIVLGVVNGAVSAASLPAASAVTPQTVPKPLLRQANALVRMATNSAVIAGASVGGVIAALTSPGWALAVTGVVFLVAAGCYLGVTVPDADDDAPLKPLAELREGWTEFTARTWVWVVVVQFMVINAAIVGGVQVLGPSIADATFGRTAWGFVLAAQTAGALVGGLLASRWQPRRALATGVALAAVEAVPLITLAQSPRVVPLLIAMFVAGVAIEQLGIAWDVALQENVPPDRLARVYSYDAVGSFVAIPLGEILVGPLAVRFGAGPTLLGGAVLVVLATAGALASRDLRRLSRQDGRLDRGNLASTAS